jgi:hypothetical protein
MRKMGKQIRKPGKAHGRRRSDTPATRAREDTMTVIVRALLE